MSGQARCCGFWEHTTGVGRAVRVALVHCDGIVRMMDWKEIVANSKNFSEAATVGDRSPWVEMGYFVEGEEREEQE